MKGSTVQLGSEAGRGLGARDRRVRLLDRDDPESARSPRALRPKSSHDAVPVFSSVYWTSLTIIDALAAALLFFKPRLGVMLTLFIIATNVVHNTALMWWMNRMSGWLNIMYLSQVTFLPRHLDPGGKAVGASILLCECRVRYVITPLPTVARASQKSISASARPVASDSGGTHSPRGSRSASGPRRMRSPGNPQQRSAASGRRTIAGGRRRAARWSSTQTRT